MLFDFCQNHQQLLHLLIVGLGHQARMQGRGECIFRTELQPHQMMSTRVRCNTLATDQVLVPSIFTAILEMLKVSKGIGYKNG